MKFLPSDTGAPIERIFQESKSTERDSASKRNNILYFIRYVIFFYLQQTSIISRTMFFCSVYITIT